MEQVRIGIIGVGSMGMKHAKYIYNGEIEGAVLTAVLVSRPEQVKTIQTVLEGISIFCDEDGFFQSDLFDAVLIATPHYDHPRFSIKAFDYGLHVLCEKPAGVYTKQVKEMITAANKSGSVFSIMYNQRTNPLYQKLRELIQTGQLGNIRRINWIITNWYRTQSYYDSKSWRATWAGEGGGVLINQSFHQLDLWQWIIGMMPARLRSFCHFGKYRNIEVEDEVTAYLEYEGGATGVLITTTGEAPGTNRLEIAGDLGKAVIEDDQLSFWRLKVSELEFNRDYKGDFGKPECNKFTIPIEENSSGHRGITQNFVNAIRNGTSLIASGSEGMHALLLSNAMLLSTWEDKWIEFPFDEELYYDHLRKRINFPSK